MTSAAGNLVVPGLAAGNVFVGVQVGPWVDGAGMP